jgi:acylpyruvate hydrolase
MKSELQVCRNIWAVGRNYADHAKELGHSVPQPKSNPMIFLKAGSCLVFEGDLIHLPSHSTDVHNEVELALRFGANGHFDAYTLGLDLTARDIQNQLKAANHPWTLAKSFRDANPIGGFRPLKPGRLEAGFHFNLKKNGDVVQRGNSNDMIHSFEKLRIYVLEHFPVETGDILMTGTPAGVGPIKSGDTLELELEDSPSNLVAQFQVR